jgi:polysaccharide export outer membrane protein
MERKANSKWPFADGSGCNRIFRLVLLLSFFFSFYGCDHNNRDLDPSQIGRFRPVPAVNVILDSLGVEDEEPSVWEGAEDPLPEDAIVDETDYTFGAGDIVRVSIFELLQDGQTFVNDYIVNETGKINIIEVGVIEAAGLTERQLEEEIRNILKPNILKEPLVTVTLLRSQKQMYSINGLGVNTQGRYNIPRYDFRLLDAIAQAGGMGQYNISYVYVSRMISEEKEITGPIKSELLEPVVSPEMMMSEPEMLKMILPKADEGHTKEVDIKEYLMTSSEMVTDEELLNTAQPDSLDILSQIAGIGRSADKEPSARVEWIFQDGKWVPIQIGEPKEKFVWPEIEPKREPSLKFKAEPEETPRSRLIKIPSDKLATGDPRYNIVVRSGDRIQVPVDMIGEFCIMGNVNRPNFYALTGRPLTLKMAIAAAGGLTPLAQPKHCEITRRIGRNKEETVMVNLDKIARGEQPDFFIKPHDWINIGTDPAADWRYKLRNAFRATYGFGFVYDSNFGNREFGMRHPLGPFGVD